MPAYEVSICRAQWVYIPYIRPCDKRRLPYSFQLGAWRTHESEKRRLSFPAPRVLFGTDHMINEAEPPRSRRRLCLYTSDSARISFSPSSSAFSSSSAVTVTGALKDDADDADGVECLGDVGIDEQLSQRQKEQGVVDLTGEFNAVG